MGSRVVVMSARPGRIKLDRAVPLAHPRHYSVKTTRAVRRAEGRADRAGAGRGAGRSGGGRLTRGSRSAAASEHDPTDSTFRSHDEAIDAAIHDGAGVRVRDAAGGAGAGRLPGEAGAHHRPVRRGRRRRRAAAHRRREARGRSGSSRSSSRTSRAPPATSAWRRARAPSPTATRCCSRPAGNLTVNPTLFRNLPLRHLRRTSRRSRCWRPSPNVLVVHPSVPAKTFKELVAYAKAEPGQAQLRLARRRQRRAPGRRAAEHRGRHPDGAHPVQGHRAGGERPARRQRADDVRRHLDRAAAHQGRQAGGARDREPARARRSCPTCRPSPRAACPGFDVTSWYGIVVRAGTPPPIIQKLQRDMAEALQGEDVQREARRPRPRAGRQHAGRVRRDDQGREPQVDRDRAQGEHQAAAVRPACSAIDITYLNGPDVETLALTDDEILAAVEAALARAGRGETVIEPRVHLDPGVVREGALQRAARLRQAARRRGRQGRRRLRRQLQARPAVRDGAAQPVRSRDRHAARGDRRDRDHRHAHRRDDRARRQAPRAQGQRRCSATSARAAPRTGTCGCSTACSTSTRSACTRAGRRAATRSAQRLSQRPRQAGARDRRLGVVRARRRHRGRGLAAAGADAAAEDRVDQAGRASSCRTAR